MEGTDKEMAPFSRSLSRHFHRRVARRLHSYRPSRKIGTEIRLGVCVFYTVIVATGTVGVLGTAKDLACPKRQPHIGLALERTRCFLSWYGMMLIADTLVEA